MQPKDSIQARYIAYWLTERGFHVAAMEVMTAISVDVLRKKIESTQQSSPDQFPTSEVSEQSAGPNKLTSATVPQGPRLQIDVWFCFRAGIIGGEATDSIRPIMIDQCAPARARR